MTYRSINILDAIEQIGESATQELISDFSYSKNQDIQHFLQHNAIDFAKKRGLWDIIRSLTSRS